MSDSPSIQIQGREIGGGHPVYVIAEISANHHQKYEEAVRLVRAAKECGADAVKLQTYTPDTITFKSDAPAFRHGSGSLWEGRTLYDLYEEAYMPWDWQPKLKAEADALGLQLFSSPFDETAVDFLSKMGVPAFKVASFEIVDIPLIETIARTGKPMIMSTGMATFDEIREAVQAARSAGAKQVALLKCNSAYPAAPDEMNLRTIPQMALDFVAPVGLSDHTLGTAAAITAVVLGACIVEKHFTLSRSTPGPDAAFSLEPAEFKAMVDAIRTAERALGGVSYGPTSQEAKSLPFRPSLFVVRDVRAGAVFTGDNVKSIRPAAGLHPRFLSEVLGRHAARDIKAGTPLAWDLVK